jgi:hypothetical protein
LVARDDRKAAGDHLSVARGLAMFVRDQGAVAGDDANRVRPSPA